MTQLLYDEAQGRAMLGGIGRSKFYELVADGKIRIVKIGRRTFVTHEELVRYVASLNGEGKNPPGAQSWRG